MATVAYLMSLKDETAFVDSTLKANNNHETSKIPLEAFVEIDTMDHCQENQNPFCFDIDGEKASSYDDIFADDSCNPSSSEDSPQPSLTPEDIQSMNSNALIEYPSAPSNNNSKNEMNQRHFDTLHPAQHLPISYSSKQIYSSLLNGTLDDSERDHDGEQRNHHIQDQLYTLSDGVAETKLKEHAANIQYEKRKTFPHQLHEMLDEVEKSNLEHIVSWQPHGRCFLVHEPKAFVRLVMAKLFRQTKWSSFQRQLNLYGFKRLTDGPDKGGYFHHLFLRGKRHMCDSIYRTKIKGTRVRVASNPDLEPNFYSMPALDERAANAKKESSSYSLSSVNLSPVVTNSKFFHHVTDKSFSQLSQIPSSQSMSTKSDPGAASEMSDDPTELQALFARIGKPINLDDLDQLPQDDIGWGCLLENILG